MSPTPTDLYFMKSSYPHKRLSEVYGLDYGIVLLLGDKMRTPVLAWNYWHHFAEEEAIKVLGWTVLDRLKHDLREVMEHYR